MINFSFSEIDLSNVLGLTLLFGVLFCIILAIFLYIFQRIDSYNQPKKQQKGKIISKIFNGEYDRTYTFLIRLGKYIVKYHEQTNTEGDLDEEDEIFVQFVRGKFSNHVYVTGISSTQFQTTPVPNELL